MKHRIFILCLLLCLAASASAWQKKTGAAKSALGETAAGEKSSAILPPSFNGWQKSAASVKTSTDPSSASQTDAVVLKEYEFSDAELATYVRDDRKMEVKAARFNNASGAYGAFTFYMQPQMRTEQIPDLGVSNNTRVLFYRGNLLLDVSLDRVTAMSAADLRALSDALPRLHGDLSALSSLPYNLPKQSYMPHTAHFVTGPAALERLGVPVPAALVDFSKKAEVMFAKYRSSIGEANLMIIGYPTPQIAMERLRAFQSAALPGGPFYFRRSYSWLVIVNGDVPANEAQSLLASVNYDANVTWNQATKPNPRDDVGNAIVTIFVLIGILMLSALIMGFAFGGIRILVKKFFPNKVFDRPERMEIIQLNLK
jgi:hypothetical protein